MPEVPVQLEEEDSAQDSAHSAHVKAVKIQFADGTPTLDWPLDVRLMAADVKRLLHEAGHCGVPAGVHLNFAGAELTSEERMADHHIEDGAVLILSGHEGEKVTMLLPFTGWDADNWREAELTFEVWEEARIPKRPEALAPSISPQKCFDS